MEKPSKYDAVVFDLDGTLLDTLQDIADSVNAALAEEGLAPYPVDRYRLMVGNGMDVLVERAIAGRLDAAGATTRCLDRARGEYARRYNATTRPYDGIPPLLDELAARGLKMAVLSNKPDEYTGKIIREYLDGYFKIVRGARSDHPKKPDPTQALEILVALGVAPERSIMLGDSGGDMETALRAGMFPAGVLWGFRDADELRSSGARALIKHPMDILDLF
ncbi:MAG TPA: HAD-IA family hydrolase [Spirochaetota bacterium]|nr:HAD-IA family hydrolase [Spirochaetota bacterium]